MPHQAELKLDLARPWVAERRAEGLGRGVCRLLDAMGYAPLIEVRLSSGRRVDVLAQNRRGLFVVAEIKSSVADFRSDNKWAEYLPHCDRFYFAVSGEFPHQILPDTAGVIIADRFGADILREAPSVAMNGGVRRRQAIRFGRIAASRLRFIHNEVG